jgi:hypothetical protein
MLICPSFLCFRSTSRKKSRLQEFLATSQLPSLTPEEVTEIDDAGKKVHYRQFVRAQPFQFIKVTLTARL